MSVRSPAASEQARSLAWSLSLVYSAQLFAIEYNLHYRHPLGKVSQKKLALEVGAKDILSLLPSHLLLLMEYQD